MHWNSIFENLTGVIIPVLFVATILGIMLSSILYAIYAIVPGKLKSYFTFDRRTYFKAALVLIPVAGCMFGVVTGYYAEWWSHHFDPCYTGVGEPWWTIFAAPGDGIASCYGGDWLDDEAWDYRGDIMFWNGLFWMILALITSATWGILAWARTLLDSHPTTARPSPLA
jgi:hypothetical protein